MNAYFCYLPEETDDTGVINRTVEVVVAPDRNKARYVAHQHSKKEYKKWGYDWEYVDWCAKLIEKEVECPEGVMNHLEPHPLWKKADEININ